MEQLTPGEWAKEQLRRAPSFVIAMALVVVLLAISAFIEYSSARPGASLSPVEAELAELEPPPLDDIKDEINPEKPDLPPVEDAPEAEEEERGQVEAPLDDTTFDMFIDDITSEEVEATDPFPEELTRKLATIGTGPGTGSFPGRFGSRTRGGRRRAARKFGMPKGTDKDILAGLRWLKKVQEPDGSWLCGKKWGGSAHANCGVTGLALLAFLGYGCTDKDPREFAPTVKKAINYLVNRQNQAGGTRDQKGWFGERMYSQGICTMALAEAHGMKVGGKKVRDAAQAGLNYILKNQGENGGFGYVGPGNDTSVTGFQLQAIKAGLSVGLNVPEPSRKKTEVFLTRCVNTDGSTSYHAGQGGGTVPMTAASLTGRLFLGHSRKAKDCAAQAKWLATNNHRGFAQPPNNLYAIYYLSLSMFNMGGQYWKDWNKAFNIPLRARQVKSGADKGSWPHDGVTYGGHGGRIYTTAMAILSLEVYWRYQISVKSPSRP